MRFFIEQTRVNPEVEFIPNENILSFKGRSSPENPLEFYRPVMNFVDKFSQSGESILVLNMYMAYFNTSSTKCLYNIFRRLDQMQDQTGKVVVINWYYEDWDDDMLEAGEDFSAELGVEFNLVEVEDLNEVVLSTSEAA